MAVDKEAISLSRVYLNLSRVYFRIGLRFTSNVTASWSLMPGVVCVLVMMEGLEVSMGSRMLPNPMRVGSFTIFRDPNSLIISHR